VISPTSTAKAPVFAVVIHEKGGAERREVFEASEISVGRVQGNDLMLPKGNVSKRHARLLYRDGRFIVTDLNSTNGTYVNRRRITQATIVREGDRIYIGDFVLRIELPAGVVADDESSRDQPRPADSSQSQGSMRPIADSIDESVQVPSPPRVPASNPAASDSLRLTPASSAEAASAGRVTHEEFVLDETTGMRDVVSMVVSHVAARLSPDDLNRSPDSGTRASVDRLIREAWGAHQQGANPSIDSERVMRAARAELLDLGPLAELIRDPQVLEVGVSRFDRISVVRGSQKSVEVGFSSETALRWAIQRLCESAGTPLATNESALERSLPDGMRLEAVLGASGNAVAILRRPRSVATSLEELVRRGTISRAIATLLQQCVTARLNVLVVGARDGGCEQLQSALSLGSSEGAPVWISSSMAPPSPSMARVDAELGGPELKRAIRVASRLPNARLLVELSSGPISSSVTEAIADGADGVVASCAAPSLSRGLSRLCAALTAEGTTPAAAREVIAASFELCVEVARLRDGRYRVLRVAEMLGATADAVHTQDVFTFVMDRTAAGGAIEGSFVPSGAVPHVAEVLRSRGIILESTMFSRPPSR
jgi:pilus assembly protein CpaF